MAILGLTQPGLRPGAVVEPEHPGDHTSHRDRQAHGPHVPAVLDARPRAVPAKVLELHPEQLAEPARRAAQGDASRRRIFADNTQLVAPSPRRHALAIRMSPRVLPAQLIDTEVP